MEDFTKKTLAAKPEPRQQKPMRGPSPAPTGTDDKTGDVVLAASKQSPKNPSLQRSAADPLSQEAFDDMFADFISQFRNENAEEDVARDLRNKDIGDRSEKKRGRQQQERRNEEKRARSTQADAEVALARPRLEADQSALVLAQKAVVVAQNDLLEKERVARELRDLN